MKKNNKLLIKRTQRDLFLKGRPEVTDYPIQYTIIRIDHNKAEAGRVPL